MKTKIMFEEDGLMKKIMVAAVIMVVACLFVSLGAQQAKAGDYWYTCTVNMVGANNAGGAYINLTATAPSADFSNRWFQIGHGATFNAILASGLTAGSGSKTALVELFDPGPMGVVIGIYAQ